jgi:hypothetical protein
VKSSSFLGFPACLASRHPSTGKAAVSHPHPSWSFLWMGVWRLGEQADGKRFPNVGNGFPPWERVSIGGKSFPWLEEVLNYVHVFDVPPHYDWVLMEITNWIYIVPVPVVIISGVAGSSRHHRSGPAGLDPVQPP